MKIFRFWSCFLIISCGPLGGGVRNSFLPSYQILAESPIFCSEDHDLNKTNILFVIDKTASNKNSDPDHSKRLAGIQQLIDSQDSEVGYGMIVFSKKAQSLLMENDVPVFRSKGEEVQQALDTVAQMRDTGKKLPAEEILQLIKQAIEKDSLKHSAYFVDYHIVFISDGSFSANKGQQQLVQGIGKLTQDTESLKVHSVYYGNYKNESGGFKQKVAKGAGWILRTWLFIEGVPISPTVARSAAPLDQDQDTDDVTLLKTISTGGQGVYTDSNQQEMDLSHMLSRWEVNRLMVYNLNSGVCLDGSIDVDSDADGLCDKDEEGEFLPDNRWSFEDGYSDYFHWYSRENNQPLPKCIDRSDLDQDLLTHCEELYLNSLFQHSEGLVSLRTDHPDSDGDGVIDGIEVLMSLADFAMAPLDPSYTVHKQDISASSDLSVLPYEDSRGDAARLVPLSGAKSCYGLQQSAQPVYPTLPVSSLGTLNALSHKSGENVALIYYIQHMEGLDREMYKFSFQSLKGESDSFVVSPELSHFQSLALIR